MSRKKKKNSTKRTTKKPPTSVKATPKRNRWKTVLTFLAGSGILVALLSVAYKYMLGNVALEYVQPVGRSYEFQLKNDTPVDKTVKSFRFDPPRTQKVVYQITDNIYADVNKDNSVAMPGGNISYVPAAEFKELDGLKLVANSSLKFRVPPLSSRPWMQPEASIVDVKIETESSNLFLQGIERLLASAGIRSPVRNIRYLVINNYWTESHSTSIDEAIRLFCRDNDEMAKSSICTGKP